MCAWICVYLFLYKCIYIYVHPHDPPSTRVCPCTHTHAGVHTKLFCYCSGLHVTEVMYQNHISLVYFVIRFFKVFNMVRGFFLITHSSTSHDVNCTLHTCTWCSPRALCACISKCAFCYIEIACEYHVPIQQMGNLRDWDILWSQHSVREWQGRNNNLKQSWVPMQWFSQ